MKPRNGSLVDERDTFPLDRDIRRIEVTKRPGLNQPGQSMAERTKTQGLQNPG